MELDDDDDVPDAYWDEYPLEAAEDESRRRVIGLAPTQAEWIADLVNNPPDAPRLRAAIERHSKKRYDDR